MHKIIDRLIKPIQRLDNRRFENIVTIILGVLFFVSLLAGHVTRPYNSDDVTTQTVVQSWEDGRPRNAIVGEDTYIIKMPFFALHDLLEPHNSRTKLLVSVLVFNAVLFIGLVYFLRTIIKFGKPITKIRLLLAYLPLGWWLALSATPFAGNRNVLFMNPDLRNAELGIAFIVLAVLLRYFNKAKSKPHPLTLSKKIFLLLAAGFLSIYLASDPYFTFIVGLPIMGSAAILAIAERLSWRRAIITICYTGVVIVGAHLVALIVEKAGIDSFIYVSRSFIPLNKLPTALTNTFWSELNQFSANISGKLINSSLLPQIFNLLLFGLSIMALWSATKRRTRELSITSLLLSLLVGVNLLIFTLAAINNFANNRFLIIAVVSQVFALSIYGLVQPIKRNWQMTLLLIYVLGIAINFISNSYSVGHHVITHQPSANASNYAVIDLVRKEGITKGYAPYWDSLINTYLASSDIHFLPTNCKYGELHKLDWVVNKPDFDIPATKSFYLSTIDSSNCKIPSAELRPEKVIRIDNVTVLYIFNYDIGKGAPSTTL